MGGHTMLRKDVEDKEVHKLDGVYCVICWDEDTLFRQSVYYHKDGHESGGHWKSFNEIHGNGIPWLLQDVELLEQPIWLVVG
jgi:hypothetical protein